MIGRLTITMLATAVMLAVPAAARAATTCDYATQVLQVDLAGSGDQARLQVADNGEISVRGALGAVIECAGLAPTVTNTNAISVFNHTGSANNLITLADAGEFVPGATAETGDDEIEIFPTLNGAPGSVLQVTTADAGGATRFGDGGINPNAVAGEVTPDADILPAGVTEIRGYGSDGPDILGAQGGAGTGNAITRSMFLQGGQGADSVTGGDGDDVLFGSAGADTLVGGAGRDDLLPGPDDDIVDGGPGTDIADYGEHQAGVRVDLAQTGPQATGASGSDSLVSMEDLRGTAHADVLLGDGGPNDVDGLVGGDDQLVGRGGIDSLYGRDGADSIDARDGGPDTVDCGTGTDQATVDAAGVDALTACETTLFPPAPGPPLPLSPGVGATTPVPARDRAPARLTGYRLSRKRFRARAGTTVRFTLSERATVRFTVQRLRRGRYRALKGSLVRRATKGVNRFQFSGRWRGRRLAEGRYKLVAAATDTARNRSRPRAVRFRVLSR